MNNNTFYRIANDTGIKKRSYINGKDIPFFKPGITGMNYHQRKVFII